jgi:hypothetical protein
VLRSAAYPTKFVTVNRIAGFAHTPRLSALSFRKAVAVRDLVHIRSRLLRDEHHAEKDFGSRTDELADRREIGLRREVGQHDGKQ